MAYPELIEASKWFEEAFNKEFSGVSRLKMMREEKSLTDVLEKLWNTSRTEGLRRRYSKMCLEIFRRFCSLLAGVKGSGWSQERSDRVVRDIKEAVDEEKAYISGDFYAVIARKPA
jgi:hypothetical protein